eukprot:302970_1
MSDKDDQNGGGQELSKNSPKEHEPILAEDLVQSVVSSDPFDHTFIRDFDMLLPHGSLSEDQLPSLLPNSNNFDILQDGKSDLEFDNTSILDSSNYTSSLPDLSQSMQDLLSFDSISLNPPSLPSTTVPQLNAVSKMEISAALANLPEPNVHAPSVSGITMPSVD